MQMHPMLDATGPTHAGIYDVLAVEDPGFHRAEALSHAIQQRLEDSGEHPVVRIAALATLVTVYLQQSPPQHRAAMVGSLIGEICRESLQPDA